MMHEGEKLARLYFDAYNRVAQSFCNPPFITVSKKEWEDLSFEPSRRVPIYKWEDVPETTRKIMIAAAWEVLREWDFSHAQK